MELEAFKRDILPLKHRLYRFALSFLRNDADAEDAVQEILVKTWTHRDELDRLDSAEAWIMRVARNHCLDVIKARKHRVVELHESRTIASSEPDPAAQTAWRDAFSRVHDIMDGLPEQQRTALFLREIEERTYREIAQMTGNSLDAVKVNLFRARRTVRERFQKIASYGN